MVLVTKVGKEGGGKGHGGGLDARAVIAAQKVRVRINPETRVIVELRHRVPVELQKENIYFIILNKTDASFAKQIESPRHSEKSKQEGGTKLPLPGCKPI